MADTKYRTYAQEQLDDLKNPSIPDSFNLYKEETDFLVKCVETKMKEMIQGSCLTTELFNQLEFALNIRRKLLG